MDVDGRQVRTRNGTLAYDYLVVAFGAQPRPDLVEGASWAVNRFDAEDVARKAGEVRGVRRGRVAVGILGLPYKRPPAPDEAVLLLNDFFRSHGLRNQVELVAFSSGVTCWWLSRLTALRRRWCAAAWWTTGGCGWIPGPCGLATRASSRLGTLWRFPWPTACPCPRQGGFAEAQARVAASHILHELGLGQPSEFDSYGYCFVEVGEQKATKIVGRFLTPSGPQVQVAEPTREAWEEKRRFEQERLGWLEGV